jgi:CBS domain containing-hemolysin-like protein
VIGIITLEDIIEEIVDS